MADEGHVRLVHEIFGAWLNSPGLHGCSFATAIAKTPQIRLASFFGIPDQDAVRQLTEHIQVAASARHFAIAIFPDVVLELQLRIFIDLLGISAGWVVDRLNIPGRFAVAMRWASSAALQSSVMGFAPFGTMPVTRRAPYVAVALWPCGYDNPRRKKPDAFIGVGDTAHTFADDRYDRMQAKTRARVKATRAMHADASLFTGMTFCLPDAAS
jgi:hypothetical protein